MPLTNAEVDAAIPVSGTPSRALANAALKELITDVAAKSDTSHTHAASGVTDFATAVDARIALANVSALADVAVTSPTVGQVLMWDGSNWVNDDEAGGGGGGTWGSITGTLSDQTDLNAALRVNSPYYTANAMGALAIDTSKALNTKSVSVDSTFTFSGAPSNFNTYFGLVLTNGSANNLTITIPSSYSEAQQATITTFVLPGNAVVELVWRYNGTIYILKGEPVRSKMDFLFTFIGTTTARDYPLVLKNSRPFVIESVVSKCTSGTCTATVKIDGVALGGTANAVSSSEQSQAHTSANVSAADTDVVVTTTSGAVDMQLSVKGYFTS